MVKISPDSNIDNYLIIYRVVHEMLEMVGDPAWKFGVLNVFRCGYYMKFEFRVVPAPNCFIVQRRSWL